MSFLDIESGELLEGLPKNELSCLAIVTFPKPVPYLAGLKILGSKLDTEPSAKRCRFLFHGSVDRACDHYESFTLKERIANLDRIISSTEIIGRDLVKKEGSLEHFIGCCVQLTEKAGANCITEGKISRPFGTSGKFRVDLKTPIPEDLRTSEYVIRLVYKKTLKL